MKALLLRLWNDQSGAIVSAEIMLIASILVIGVIVGLKSLRDSIVTELADVAQAIANVNQSFSFSGTSGHHAFTGGGAFNDMADFCDTVDLSDAGNSKCVLICSAGSSPSEGIPGGGGHHGGGHHGGGKGW